MSATAETTRLKVEQLHPALGARVHGVDMRDCDDATLRQVHALWMAHQVLVFPNQHVTDEEHVAFTRRLGEPEIFHQDIIKSRRVREIFRVSNVDDNGVLMPPDHPVAAQVALAQFWHTDSSYLAVPCTGALLHGIEVSRSGGETQFTNMCLAYEQLPERLKQQVEGRKARHNFANLHSLAKLNAMTEAEKAKVPAVWQPMVRIHPVTRRKSLYISPVYNDEVEGMDKAAAKALLDELTAFASQPRFVYAHRWETDDVVMWDNRCTMHAVTPFDPRERRVMHRTTIVGTEPPIAA
jgi:alpha-ketoglutarate-dependent taurine dioxygenase